MKDRYELRIRQFAQEQLKCDLGRQVRPYLNDLTPEIMSLIETEVANYPVREQYRDGTIENLGSKLDWIGKQIAEQLYATVFQQMLPHLERRIDQEKEELTKQHTQAKVGIKSLREKIQNGSMRRRKPYWRGADVIITITQVSTYDTQVITGGEALAGSLTWLFHDLGQIMRPFINYLTKLEFYGEMAEGAIKAIDSNKLNEKEILEAAIVKAEIFYQKHFEDYKKRMSVLEEAQDWIVKHKNASLTEPRSPFNHGPIQVSP